MGPAPELLASSVADLGIATGLAIGGAAMTPLPAVVLAGLLGTAVAFGAVLDAVKAPVFARLRIV